MNAPTPPEILDDAYDGDGNADPLARVPACLRARTQWVCWRYATRRGKRTKVPVDAATGREAKSDDPSTWVPFDDAVAAFRASRDTARPYAGVGYVFADDDPYAGVDLDDCRDATTGVLKPWGRALILRLGSYAEVSPSRTGVKVIVEAAKTGSSCRKRYEDGRVEIYDHKRFFTVTGERLDDFPADVMPRQEELAEVYEEVFGDAAAREGAPMFAGDASGNAVPDDASDDPTAGVAEPEVLADLAKAGSAALADEQIIAKALRSKSKDKFADLWAGRWGDRYDSRSEADSALIFLLAFYTKDPGQLDRLFRASGLMRDKWDEVHGAQTYGRTTVDRALSKVTAQWTPRDGDRDGKARADANRDRVANVAGPPAGGDGDGGTGDDHGSPDSPGGPPGPARTKVIVSDVQLSDLTRQAVDTLVAANDPPVVFVRGGGLCRVTADEQDRPRVEAYDKLRLRGRLADLADFYTVQTVGREATLVGVNPPVSLAENVLAAGAWPAFPPLLGIARAPILRADGSVCATPGYDAASGLLYRPDPGLRVPPIPDRPTAGQARAAMAEVAALVADFPFADAASRANALGVLFSLLMRPVIRGHVPLAVATAPVQGTGKSLLLTTLGIVAVGEVAGESIPSKQNDDEWRKKITSLLLEGGPFVLLDNIPDNATIDSPALAAALTNDQWSDRILGVTGNARVASRAVWAASGNNLRVTGDMPRRCYTIRLDANAEQPWERRGFAIKDLEQYAHDNRGALLAAAFTVIRGWYAAGQPRAASVPTIGSFQEWADAVGSVLVFGGVEGFLGNLAEARAVQDDDARQWAALFDAWWTILGDEPVTADVVLTALLPAAGGPEVVALPDPLAAHRDKGDKAPGALRRSLGRHLAKLLGRVFAGRKLCAAGEDGHTKVRLWRLVPLAGGANPANPAVSGANPAGNPATGGER